MFGQEISDDYKNVIASLKGVMPTSKPVSFVGETVYRNITNYDDQFTILRNYICSCGNKMERLTQTLYKEQDNTVSVNHMHCKYCDTNEKVQISVVRNALMRSQA